MMSFFSIRCYIYIHNSVSLNICDFELKKGVTTLGLGVWWFVYLGLPFEFAMDEKCNVL